MANQSKQDARRLEAAERRERALRLRLAGATYEDIGRAMAVNKSTVKRWIDAAIENVDKDSSEQLFTMENMRLDVAQRAIMQTVAQGHLGAIDRLLRIMERRARLNGLDAPQRVDLSSDPVDIDDVAKSIMKALSGDDGEPEEDPGGE